METLRIEHHYFVLFIKSIAVSLGYLLNMYDTFKLVIFYCWQLTWYFNSACSIIAGVETLHMIHKGQAVYQVFY